MSKLFQELVEKRGYSEEFLRPDYKKLVSPFLLPDAKKAVERIKEAVLGGEKVLIYGDYDVDGVTASTVMNDALKLAGVKDVLIMLPDRFKDGYGMSKKVVQAAKEQGRGLVITVDCGSRNKEIVRDLKKEGIETIITDHHEVPEVLPEAVAVVNPKRRDVQNCIENWEENSEKILLLRDLAGVGVAFTLARALVLEGLIPDGQEKWLLDLVLIGTICDSMKMTEENRRLCYYGMKVLKKTRRPGLKELLRLIGKQELTSEVIGFQIGPRLNAAGRMSSAKKALGLLMATSRPEAAKIAAELEELNKERRSEQNAAVKEIKEMGEEKSPVLVYQGEWHEGVLGIIAGRLVEEYKKPAFVFSEVGGVLKGSGSSFGEFNLAKALENCAGSIIAGGGHAGACGVKVEKEKIKNFIQEINDYYRGLKLFEQERFLEEREDLAVYGAEEFNLDFLEELKILEPFGVGNRVPIFLMRKMMILEKALMGDEGQHLRLLVRGEGRKAIKLLAFNAPEEWRRIERGQRANLWVNLEKNEFRGTASVEGRILKIGLYDGEEF
ncbi:single-stranded-DNA-specific exonuclease RecJ [Candidatus Saccharibacteria bacterium]|nr:single-stranded-DNA-specific exonuclease RecJ [Candidatus Saccharibacteria bacterium]